VKNPHYIKLLLLDKGSSQQITMRKFIFLANYKGEKIFKCDNFRGKIIAGKITYTEIVGGFWIGKEYERVFFWKLGRFEKSKSSILKLYQNFQNFLQKKKNMVTSSRLKHHQIS
jgi:hypothetical protein